MFKKPTSIFILFLLIGLWCHTCFAQEHYFCNLFNVKSRPLAMGGAFTSVEGDLEAIIYNPATFNLYKHKKDHRITIFFNPISSLVAFQKYSNNFQQSIEKTNLWEATALLLKAIVFSGSFINMGILAGEEPIKNIQIHHSKKWFDYNDVWDNSANTFFLSFKLAKRLSIGFSSTLYYDRNADKLQQGIGYSYGIFLKPNNKFNVGLSYMDFTKNMSEINMLLERIGDETMNIGVSYKPTSHTIFSLDIRNLSEENRENVRELHVGFEQSILNLLAIRVGYFKERLNANNNYSVGIGILDSNLFFNNRNRFSHHNFLINYSFVYQETIEKFNRWHFFSLLFRI